MGALLKFLKDIFDMFLFGTSAQGKDRRELKELENRLKEITPPIIKNGMVQPSLAEAMYHLWVQLAPIHEILESTIAGNDTWISLRCIDYLFYSGFSPEGRELYETLFSEKRKQLLSEAESYEKERETHRRLLEKLLRELNTPEFKAVERIICQLGTLYDLCRFNYISFLRCFDSDFTGEDPSYSPRFQQCLAVELVSNLLDFYYISSTLELSPSLVSAIIALVSKKTGDVPSEEEQNSITNRFKTIAYLLKKKLDPGTLLLLLRYLKKDTRLTPASAKIDKPFLEDYRDRLQIRYLADSKNIETEIQDEQLEQQIQELFPGKKMVSLGGYNAETNDFLKATTAYSFFWITPLQVIKTYIRVYFSESVQTLLNTLMVEGYYNNQSFQSQFSTIVHHCIKTASAFETFEKSFGDQGENNLAHLKHCIQNSHNGNEFCRKAEEMVNHMNQQAKSLVQTEAKHFYELSVKLTELLADSKRPTPEYISNIRMLISAAKNREKFECLEKQQPFMLKFLEIMKNYAIIGNTV
ncbi:MAG: DUF5312 domain-containing protein [Spirochaetaceae bacterium]|jgi:hypothetical protein|nr:DUF5312 domain-containing protein [Spirochaetaceae bacterium]